MKMAPVGMVSVVVSGDCRWESNAFEQATRRPVRDEHQQDPLVMRTLISREAAQVYDEDRRQGRCCCCSCCCCCCFGGGCCCGRDGGWNAKGKEQLAKLLVPDK